MVVGAQVVDPEPLGAGMGTAGPAIKKEHVRIHALGVEDALRKAQQGVQVALEVKR